MRNGNGRAALMPGQDCYWNARRNGGNVIYATVRFGEQSPGSGTEVPLLQDKPFTSSVFVRFNFENLP